MLPGEGLAVEEHAGGAQQAGALHDGLSRPCRRPRVVTLNSPVGCSTESSFSRPWRDLRHAGGRRARQHAGGGDRHGGEDADGGVAFVRDEAAGADVPARDAAARPARSSAPPWTRRRRGSSAGRPRGGSPRAGPSAPHRLSSIVARLVCPSVPRMPPSSTMTGMPLSISVTSTPATRSTTLPVGSSAPQTEPAASRKSMAIGAAVPGTPSMRASPP